MGTWPSKPLKQNPKKTCKITKEQNYNRGSDFNGGEANNEFLRQGRAEGGFCGWNRWPRDQGFDMNQSFLAQGGQWAARGARQRLQLSRSKYVLKIWGPCGGEQLARLLMTNTNKWPKGRRITESSRSIEQQFGTLDKAISCHETRLKTRFPPRGE